MNAKLLKDELDKYRRSYKRLVERNDELEARYHEQEERIAVLARSVEHCQKALDMNKDLMRRLGEEHNHKENDMVALLTGLKAKLREMGYNGDFDRLGDAGN